MSSFPTLFDWIERFGFLRGMPAAFLLLVSALIIIAAWEWRLSLIALTAQYLLAGLLFVEVLEPRLAIVKVLVGVFIALMLYFTARQATWPERVGRQPTTDGEGRSRWQRFVPLLTLHNGFFRLLLALILLLAAIWLAQRPGYRLPAVPDSVNLAIFGLWALGLLATTLSMGPWRTGMGLLMIMLGFELFYNSLEQSVAMLVVLATVNLTITLAIAYLTQLQPLGNHAETVATE